jgi:hypothetical protein
MFADIDRKIGLKSEDQKQKMKRSKYAHSKLFVCFKSAGTFTRRYYTKKLYKNYLCIIIFCYHISVWIYVILFTLSFCCHFYNIVFVFILCNIFCYPFYLIIFVIIFLSSLL